MLFIYSLIMYLLTPFIVLRLWYKSIALPEYRTRMFERFAFVKKPQEPFDIWIHAVSLGEVIAATPLVNEFISKGYNILMTTMTPTGAMQVKQRWGDQVIHQYIPYDLPFAVRRFFKRNQPRIGIIMETEIWPNLIHYAKKKKIPLILINARLSERSMKGYLRARWFFKPILNKLTAILAQAPDDAERFKRLGANNEQVKMIGNIKFDLNIKQYDQQPFLNLKAQWGNLRPVIILASTHEDEEEKLLHHLSTLQRAIPDVLILIAPRHPERFQSVYQLATDMGYATGLRSKPETISPEKEVIILDSMGELIGFYSVSNLAFVGGSLVPVGGHNVLEPIAVNVAVISGPHIHNFKTICRDLSDMHAIKIENDAEHVILAMITLYQHPTKKLHQIQAASMVLEQNKGALKRYLDIITHALSDITNTRKDTIHHENAA